MSATGQTSGIAEAIVAMEAVGLDVEQGIEFLRGSAVPLLLDYKAEPLANRDTGLSSPSV
jgi:hypothetical protein